MILIDLILTACSPIDGSVWNISSPCFILNGNVKELRVQLYSFHLIPLGAKQLNGIELGSSCTIGKCSTRYTIMAIKDRSITVTLAKYSFLGQAPLSMHHLKNIFLMIHALGIGFEIPIFGTKKAKN